MDGTQTNLIIPRERTPLYPDVPWWAVLVSAFVFSFLGIIIGIYSGVPGLPGTSSGVSAGALATDTMSYIPHILLLFGVLGDMFTLQGVWSIPSLTGVLSIFANYVFQYFWKGLDELMRSGKEVISKGVASQTGTGKKMGGALFEGYDGCSVQGLDAWNTKYAPQTLVITATVFSYYCYDLVRNRGWINSLGAILGFFMVYVGESAVISMNTQNKGCVVDGIETGPISQSARALFEGLLFGGVSYAIVQTYAPARLPSSTISPFPAKSASELSPGPDGRMYDSDGYPYVVLPNGMAVPDVSDAKARAAYGQMAAKSTGTTASLGSDCPAATAKCAAS